MNSLLSLHHFPTFHNIAKHEGDIPSVAVGVLSASSSSSSSSSPSLAPSLITLLGEGFSHSAHLLCELALGMNLGVHNPAIATLRPSEVPQPSCAELGFFGLTCFFRGEYRRALKYLKLMIDTEKEKRLIAIDWYMLLAQCYERTGDSHQLLHLLEQCIHLFGLDAMPLHQLHTLAQLYKTQAYPASIQPAQLLLHMYRKQPLAIEIAIDLIKMGQDPRPIYLESVRSPDIIHSLLTSFYKCYNPRPSIGLKDVKVEELLNMWQKWNEIFPRTTWLIEKKAKAQLQIHDHDIALRTLQRIHTLDPYQLAGMDLLAILMRKRFMVKELGSLVQHSLSVDECRVESWTIAACHADLLGQTEKAQRYFDKATLLNPNHEVLNMAKGFFYMNQQYELSLQAFRRVIAQPDSELSIWCVQSMVETMSRKGDVKGVKAIVDTLWEQHKRNPRVLTCWALIQDDRQRAAKGLHRAVQLDPDFSDAMVHIVDLYISYKQYQHAINMVNSHLEVHKTRKLTKRDYLHTKLAQLYALDGDTIAAMNHYQTALGITPGYMPAVEGMQNIDVKNMDSEAQDSSQ